MTKSTRHKIFHVCVDSIETNSVFCRAYDADGDDSELEFPLGTFIRIFGRSSLKIGCCGVLVIKNNRIRGWPFKRKWKAEDIVRAQKDAEKIYSILNFES